jgi:hypothetical protein
MPILSVTLDVSELIQKHQELADQIESATSGAVEKLTMMTHAHIVQEANQKLHSTREKFISSLKIEQLEDHIWGITVPEETLWIEEGLPANFDMLPGLLASPKAKTGKNGKYIVIPFKHNKNPTQSTAFQKILANAIKQEMGKRNIPYGNIEKNPDGSPKVGLLHKFNVNTPAHSNELKPGVSGPQGHHMAIHSRPQGTQAPQSGRPYLWGVRVYQNEIKNSQGNSSFRKDIMTFRTASESQKGNKWIHPGIEKRDFLGQAQIWAERQWETVILPEIIQSLGIK